MAIPERERIEEMELEVLPYPYQVARTDVPNTLGSRLEHRHPENSGGGCGGSLPPPGPESVPARTRTKSQILQGRLQLATLFWTMFLAGWHDGSIGPLLPRVQEVYHINDTIVSLIFVFSCLGFVIGATVIVPLFEKLGFGRSQVNKISFIPSTFQHMIASALQSAKLPFPAFVMAYTLAGIGISTLDAGTSAYVANIKDSPGTKMSLLHAIYGCGAFCAPLVSTQFARLPQYWSFHFLVSLGIGGIAVVALLLVFRLRSMEDSLAAMGQPRDENDTVNEGSLKHILKQTRVHLLALYILVFIGVEVTIGGWIVTYVIRLRDGGSNSGYISSGFYAGPVLLLWFNTMMGERLAAVVYSLLAIGLELIVWLVPSLIGEGVSIAIVGLFLGPLYPIAMNHARRILPRWMLTGSIGWICGVGQTGAAIVPFATGALAGKFGIGSLQPLLVAMMAFMIVLWVVVPGGPKRMD
ncbi:hypothetical protein V5O48_016155 [Marasmius crinis-equi]|uniref:Major facilitator superfamily (MFS) profile domain-containing protein n=1 Tax=Marasmius crinis-equi TaxID=585013 RepID=A0ABR3ESI1_9AGAR